MSRTRFPEYPHCPRCGETNYSFGYSYVSDGAPAYRGNHESGPIRLGCYLDPQRAALRGGNRAGLRVRKGRIYGGLARHRGLPVPSPVRVNERHWKIVRVAGVKDFVACAHEFHNS